MTLPESPGGRAGSNSDMSEPEDILTSSLQSLYSYAPVTFSSPGHTFTHPPSGLTFASPDTASSNWGLHASSIWIASLFLANHIDDIQIILPSSSRHGIIDVLELGAGSGLPGIVFATRHARKANVTLSDYPDSAILHCLEENISRNNLSTPRVRVMGHSWGQSTAELGTFDIVLAADTLWNSEMHVPLCQTLSRVLRRNEDSRAYLVAGLHTGRWTIHRFLEKLGDFDLAIDRMIERKVDDHVSTEDDRPYRDWKAEREGEEESERRNWVIWIVVKWVDGDPP